MSGRPLVFASIPFKGVGPWPVVCPAVAGEGPEQTSLGYQKLLLKALSFVEITLPYDTHKTSTVHNLLVLVIVVEMSMY